MNKDITSRFLFTRELTPYSRAIFVDNPTAYYRLDEAIGTLALDQTSNHFHGTISATGVSLGATGCLLDETDSAMLFNGSSGYLTLPAATNGGGWANLSVECWFNLSTASLGAFTNIISGDNTGSNHLSYSLYWAGTTQLTFVVGNATTTINAHYNTTAAANTRIHVVGTYDGANVRIYVNGVLRATTPLTGTVGAGANAPIVGANYNHSASYFPGTIDEVAIYQTALADTHIRQHYFTSLMQKDILSRLRLKSADQLKDILSRLRLISASKLADSVTRVRLSQAVLKDVTSRLRLMSARMFSDSASRLRLISANTLRDVSSRLRLMSANVLRDMTSRMPLMSASQLKDAVSQFRVMSANVMRDVTTRLRLQSASQMRHVASRFSLAYLRDIGTRLPLMSAPQLRDVNIRLILATATQKMKNAASRIRLRSADQLFGIGARFRLSQFRDISSSLHLSQFRLKDTIARLRLMSSNSSASLASRLRLMSPSLLSAIPSRFHLKSADLLRDMRSRFSLMQLQAKDLIARLDVRSADQKRDVSARISLRSANILSDVIARFRLRSGMGSAFITSRLNLARLLDLSGRFRLAKFADVRSRFPLMTAHILKNMMTRLRLKSVPISAYTPIRFPLGPSDITALTLYGSSIPSIIIPLSGTLSYQQGGVLGYTTTLNGTASGYGELTAFGSTDPWFSLPHQLGPAGRGWFWDDPKLESHEILPGYWRPIVSLSSSTDVIITDITVNIYLYDIVHGVYTPIISSTAIQQVIIPQVQSFALPAAPGPLNYYAPGQRLYANIWLNITRPGTTPDNTLWLWQSSTSLGVENKFQIITPGYRLGGAAGSKDIPSRFRLKKPNDLTTRLVLASGKKDLSCRFVLMPDLTRTVRFSLTFGQGSFDVNFRK